GLGEGAGDAEHHAFAVAAADADGDEHGAVAHGAVEADLDVGGVEDEVGDLGQRAVAPEFELGGEAGDLGGGDFQAAEFFEDLGDAAGGNALEIHFGDGGLERAVGTGAGFEQRGAEDFRAAADLRDGEVELADGGLQ